MISLKSLVVDTDLKSADRYNAVVKKLYETGKDYMCLFCDSEVSHKEIGNNEVALDIGVNDGTPYVGVYHQDCCPCQTEPKLVVGKWEELDVRFDNPGNGSKLDYQYIGMLTRCPFCFKIYDDDGTEVKL
jgi:hypothetical protein